MHKKLKRSLIVLSVLVLIPVGIFAKKGVDHYFVGYLERAIEKHDQIILDHTKAIENEKRDRLVTLCTLFRLKSDLGFQTKDETKVACVPEEETKTNPSISL